MAPMLASLVPLVLAVWILSGLMARKWACHGLEPHRRFYGCQLDPDLTSRVSKDLRVWRALGGVTEEHVLAMGRMCRNTSMLEPRLRSSCHVAEGYHEKVSPRFLISDGNVYLTHLNPGGYSTGHPDVVGFMLELYELSRTYVLPNVEFGYWAQDEASDSQDLQPKGGSDEVDWQWQGVRVQGPEGPLPLMVFSKTERNVGLTVPCYSSARCKDDFDTMYANLEHFWHMPWEMKKPIAFGRYNKFCTPYTFQYKFNASDEPFPDCVREHLHRLSDAHPDLLDVGYVLPAEGGRPYVPLNEQISHKYVLSTDGWTSSCKLERYMLLGSTLLKARSDRISWFYDVLRPWVNMVPFLEQNATDILQAVEWLRQHDDDAHRIAVAAQTFAVRSLNKQSRMCYLFTLLQELAKVFRYVPSCGARRLCVPLAAEVLWLSQHRPHSCRYHELLMRHVADDPLASAPLPQGIDLTAIHQDKFHHGWEGNDLRHTPP